MIRIQQAAVIYRIGVSSPMYWYTSPIYINPDKICLIEKIPFGENGLYSLDITLSTGEKIYSNDNFDELRAKLKDFALINRQIGEEKFIDVLINKNMIVCVDSFAPIAHGSNIIFDVLDLSYASRKQISICVQESADEVLERLG